ncbi:MAG TPA: tetratricopeptide repeat protein [Desulfobacterales bacterium]
MSWMRWFLIAALVVLSGCQTTVDKGTIGQLRDVQIEIKEEKIEGGLDKAMMGYQHFLEETPDSALAPEAIRRLADLKIEKEYGTITEGSTPTDKGGAPTEPKPRKRLTAPEPVVRPLAAGIETAAPADPGKPPRPQTTESDADFENRASQSLPSAVPPPNGDGLAAPIDDLDRASTREAIALYQKLLNDHPLYERNDQVLYQMSRAYEELGRTEEAMAVMDRMVRQYPRSRYIDEVQFRRAEHFFAHKHYLDAEEAYASVVDMGVGSSYYELALYKLGWTFYKQEFYEEGLHRFIALLDHKVSVGYDFEQTEDEPEHKRTEDTFRVISLSFSNLGGSDVVVEYFERHGNRSYEHNVYSNLAEFYFDKRRYADASATYSAFVSRNPFHKLAPNFHMRVIEIHAAGGFPSLVLESKKAFATTYGLKAEYWQYFEPEARPDVLGHLKTNLTDLANHYHASYQNPKLAEDKKANFKEALHWYREFLASFPMDTESPVINYQLADLLMENQSFGAAAVEYEKTAYDYPEHENASQAGYAAVYAYREHLAAVAPEKQAAVKEEVVRSSLKFADTFPGHEKAAIVLGAAADDLYVMKQFEPALAAAGKLIETFPKADTEVVRAAWLVVGHASYELERYPEAENGYLKVLALLPAGDKTRDERIDNLAASIYQQGDQARTAEDYRTAADHFLRVGRMAPTSTIRPTAEYDGAAALIQLEDWETAATVLNRFRRDFPGHELQPEVTKKIAFVYRQSGRLSLAAAEYERIETESRDDEVRMEALLVAAELYIEDGKRSKALEVYQRYVGYFPQPVEVNLETRNKIAEILKEQKEREAYLNELRQIVAIDAAAGSARTDRTRYLAAGAALVLAEVVYEQFTAVRLVQPFETNLLTKRNLMKTAVQQFNRLIEYEFGEFTAAATFYLAEIYGHFSKALMTSERPEGLSPLELEQYELAIEEQAYPFEEKAIEVHESNLELISHGIYNDWIDKSLQKLAKFMPARYAKPEAPSAVIRSLDMYVFEIDRPAGQPVDTVAQGNSPLENTGNAAASGPAETEPGEPVQVERSGDAVSGPTESGTVDNAGAEAQRPPDAAAGAEDAETPEETSNEEPGKVSESMNPDETETAEPIEDPDTESTAASRAVREEADTGLAAGAAVQ